MDVVFLAAGKGTRFSDVDPALPPKPAIPVMGTTMLEFSYKNIKDLLSDFRHDPTIVYSNEHIDHLQPILTKLVSEDPLLEGRTVEQVGFVNGPAESALHVTCVVHEDSPLLLVNCDQYIEVDLIGIAERVKNSDLDGAILTFTSDDPRYSYIEVDAAGVATNMVEKQVISSMASCGVVLWARAGDFYNYARELKTKVTDKERYISDVCQLAILDGKKFDTPAVDVFIDLGTPADLENLEEKWNKR